MSQHNPLEDRLAMLGAALQARSQLTDRVMEELRRVDGQLAKRRSATVPPPSLRRKTALLTATAGSALVIAAVLVSITLSPVPQNAWAQVTEAIRSQEWIRGTVTHNGEHSTMWLSPTTQVWAFQLGKSIYFYDARERVKYEYHGGDTPITKLPLGEQDWERVLPLGALAQGEQVITPWLLGTEKVLHQDRRDITEEGKKWIEFQLVLWRGDRNQATLRVDPITHLPVHLVLTSPKDVTDTARWQFDYPADGPSDIYALGVPRDTKINDLMPAVDAQQVLREIAANRARIGDFRMLVVPTPGFTGFGVWRKGDHWRVERCFLHRHPEAWPSTERPEGPDAGQWFDEQLQGVERVPVYVCDGRTVWANSSARPGAQAHWEASKHIAPQDLMSGEGLGSMSAAQYVKFASLLHPDLSPKRGWGFTFELNPTEVPGSVLIKRSARLATSEPLVGHEWYYIDPTKGHSVVCADLFTSAPDTPANPNASKRRQTIRIERFQQTSTGSWYCTTIHDSTPMLLREGNLPADGTIRYHETTVRYYYDFDGDLPDSLFSVRVEQ